MSRFSEIKVAGRSQYVTWAPHGLCYCRRSAGDPDCHFCFCFPVKFVVAAVSTTESERLRRPKDMVTTTLASRSDSKVGALCIGDIGLRIILTNQSCCGRLNFCRSQVMPVLILSDPLTCESQLCVSGFHGLHFDSLAYGRSSVTNQVKWVRLMMLPSDLLFIYCPPTAALDYVLDFYEVSVN